MHQVYDQAFGAKTPTYNAILQLDRKLRGFHVPPILQIAGFGSVDTRVGSYDSVPLILQRHLVLAIRESSELLLGLVGSRVPLAGGADPMCESRSVVCVSLSLRPILFCITGLNDARQICTGASLQGR
jgi:hypothetical protein